MPQTWLPHSWNRLLNHSALTPQLRAMLNPLREQSPMFSLQPSNFKRGCSWLTSFLLIRQICSEAALSLQSRTSIHNSIKSSLTVTRLCLKQTYKVLFMVVANHQLAAAFRHRNTPTFQGVLESTEVVPCPKLKTQTRSRITYHMGYYYQWPFNVQSWSQLANRFQGLISLLEALKDITESK